MFEFLKNLSIRAKIILSVSVVSFLVVAVTLFLVTRQQNTGSNFELEESRGRVSTTPSSTANESSETKSASYYNNTHARAVEKLEKQKKFQGKRRIK